ncbi:uncharacterized protein PODANS_2_6740 [Podospora anserina S mat+]|uniref:Podospora anserina S mat+ genomic DNA chromosome 2, supercontig 2 n=1 Tax=Podospora anserina (strain S / ATCC MYA-4624 / DSM 980 / FGSC 10383) TaxID=515849 RepID=B2B652_PODAN|nr:uncharacterized protein PODANS_2_6740 [Podospora anserina S mat+]CAP73277.1 unnamed protein product [Podospora anserina S mat+]CDP25678.1 Putative protein of unknown function [Podospora anserina S mat+]
MGAAAYGGPFSIPDEGHFGGHVLAIEEEAKKVLYLAIFPLHFRKHPFLALCHVPMSGLQMLPSARLDIGITSHKNVLEPRPAPCTYSTWQPSAKSLCTGNKPRINVNTLILQDLQAALFSLSSFPSTCRYRTCKM